MLQQACWLLMQLLGASWCPMSMSPGGSLSLLSLVEDSRTICKFGPHAKDNDKLLLTLALEDASESPLSLVEGSRLLFWTWSTTTSINQLLFVLNAKSQPKASQSVWWNRRKNQLGPGAGEAGRQWPGTTWHRVFHLCLSATMTPDTCPPLVSRWQRHQKTLVHIFLSCQNFPHVALQYSHVGGSSPPRGALEMWGELARDGDTRPGGICDGMKLKTRKS